MANVIDFTEIPGGHPKTKLEAVSAKRKPLPLMRDLSPPEPFPVDALGSVLAPAVRAIHDRVQAPLAMCSQSVLAASALAVQGLVNVELPSGQISPTSLFLLSIAESGERKTSVDREALKPIRKFEAELCEVNQQNQQSFENDMRAWKKACDAVEKKHKGDRAATKAALDGLGKPPEPLLTPMLTCDEPTMEGLLRLFKSGRPSLGIFSDEGGQFISGHGMKNDGGAKVRTAAGLSALWNGEPLKRVRAGEGVTILADRRLSMYLQAQPDIALIWLSDTTLLNQGFLSRVLVSAPESEIGNRLWREPTTGSALADFNRRISELIKKKTPVRADGGVNLPAMSLSYEARRAWVGFYNHVEASSGSSGELEMIRGFASKIAENAVRIATTVTVVTGGGEIQVNEMNGGIVVGQHYLSEAMRLFHASRVQSDLQVAQRAVEWARRRPEGQFSLPDLYQRGPRPIHDKAAAIKIIDILDDHGYLAKLKNGAVIDNVFRRDVWRLVSEEED